MGILAHNTAYCQTIGAHATGSPQAAVPTTHRPRYLRDSVYSSRDGMALADLGLVFVDDSNDEAYTTHDVSMHTHTRRRSLTTATANK